MQCWLLNNQNHNVTDCIIAQRLYWYKCVRLSPLLAFECTLNHCTFIHSFIHYCMRQIQWWDKASVSSGQKRQGVVGDASRKLILVPIVFIVLRIWGTLRFVVNAHFVESDVMAWIVPLQVRK